MPQSNILDEAGVGKFMVGFPDLGAVTDIAASLRAHKDLVIDYVIFQTKSESFVTEYWRFGLRFTKNSTQLREAMVRWTSERFGTSVQYLDKNTLLMSFCSRDH